MRIGALIVVLIFSSLAAFAGDDEDSIAESLKIEANHNLVRLQGYHEEDKKNKIYEEEREKGLAEFLEEQEKWDLIRERGLREYRLQKRLASPIEGSPEYLEDRKEKLEAQQEYEQARKVQAKVRARVESSQINKAIGRLESEELQLEKFRPRYERRRRGNNKWVTTSSKGGSSSAFNPGAPNNPPPAVDYSPPPDFQPAPAPYESFEDLPPPPPVYDNSQVPYDPSFGAGVEIPPPPPPPPDYDF